MECDWEAPTVVPVPIDLTTPYLRGMYLLSIAALKVRMFCGSFTQLSTGADTEIGREFVGIRSRFPGNFGHGFTYRGTLGVVKTGYSAIGQNISLISQANPWVVVVADKAPFSHSRITREFISMDVRGWWS